MTTTPPLFGLEAYQQTTDDYWTPRWIFDQMAITFDLDVAAPPGGIEWIPATRYFTKADDGLSQPWEGRVWMNAPFSEMTSWTRRFIDHRNGVMIGPLVKSIWTEEIWKEADGFVFTHTDIKFHRNQALSRILWPCFFAAFGKECVEAIGKIGKVR